MLDDEPQANALAPGTQLGRWRGREASLSPWSFRGGGGETPGLDVTRGPVPQPPRCSRSSDAMGTRCLLVPLLVLLVLRCGECGRQGAEGL